MTESQETELRTYWRELWSSPSGDEPLDIWHAMDEVKSSYLRRFLPHKVDLVRIIHKS